VNVAGDAVTLQPGEFIAPGYEIVAHLRSGNRLEVYDVWSEERACRCIVKALRSDRRADRAARRMLLTEGRLLKRLSHPHIVRCYEVVPEPTPMLVLETLGGATLAHILDEQMRRLPVGDVVWMGLHLCSALTYLHGHGWLHLDLKPSNIISDFRRAKLIDLSIAHRPGRTRALVGTVDYMAPEQAAGDYLSEATDSWGLGAVLFEALTGELPFGHVSEDVSGDEDLPQLGGRAPSIRAYRRTPAVLRETVDACLEPDPEARPTIPEIERSLVEVAGIHPKVTGVTEPM
jgi:serine/threonine protein kinase